MKALILFLFVMTAHAAETFKMNVSELESLEKRPYFLSHADWVGLAMPLAPVEELRAQLEKHTKKKLYDHGAFIAVITPAEWQILKQTLKMNTVEKLVAQHGMMKAKVKVKCLKKFTAIVAGKTEESWFIAMESDDLLDLRQHVWRRFIANGGLPNDFQWKRWSPQLTIGYTSRSVHDEDRISKDKSDCAANLTWP